MRKKLIKIVREKATELPGVGVSATQTLRFVDHLIANDVVPVVRCKDCKHFIQEEHGCNHFGYYSHTPWVDEVDFCSYGERREGE